MAQQRSNETWREAPFFRWLSMLSLFVFYGLTILIIGVCLYLTYYSPSDANLLTRLFPIRAQILWIHALNDLLGPNHVLTLLCIAWVVALVLGEAVLWPASMRLRRILWIAARMSRRSIRRAQ